MLVPPGLEPWNDPGDRVTIPPVPVLPPGAGVKLHCGTLQQAGSCVSGTIVHASGTFWYSGHLLTKQDE